MADDRVRVHVRLGLGTGTMEIAVGRVGTLFSNNHINCNTNFRFHQDVAKILGHCHTVRMHYDKQWKICLQRRSHLKSLPVMQ